MKKLLLAIAFIAASLVCNAGDKVYYVVTGSYSTLENAGKNNEGDAPIYEVEAGGKTVYRVCPVSFYNAADAKEYARGMKQALNVDAWVSPCDGLAKCVWASDMDELAPLKDCPKSTTLYYVVGGSYSSLENAKQHNTNCPDGLEGSVLETTVKGKKAYRVALGCYRSKAEAQKSAREKNDLYGTSFWVWPCKGRARVAHYGVSLRGTLIWLEAK